MDTASIIESISIIIAAWAVILGITAWRREYIGKRNLELAEDVLAMFYEARYAINGIRSPFGFAGEGTTRKTSPNESPKDKDVFDRAFVTRERYNKRSDLFSKLYSMRYRYMARFGHYSIKPFDELQAILVEILSASDTITYYWRDQAYGAFVDDAAQKSNLENIRKYESIIWKTIPEKDSITPRVDKMVSDIESQTRNILAPSVRGKFKLWFNNYFKWSRDNSQLINVQNMRKQAGTLAALATAFLGTLPLLQANTIIFWLTTASIVLLFISALILFFHDRFSSAKWNWLVAKAGTIEVEYALSGIGLSSTGISLIQYHWVWMGIIILIIGAYFIGSQIGKGISMMTNPKKVKQ